MIDRLLEAVWVSIGQTPTLLIGFIGGVMWARAMHRKLTQK